MAREHMLDFAFRQTAIELLRMHPRNPKYGINAVVFEQLDNGFATRAR